MPDLEHAEPVAGPRLRVDPHSLPHRVDLRVMDIAVRVHSDHPAVAEVAEEAFGGAARSDAPAAPGGPAVDVHVSVRGRSERADGAPEVRHRILPGHRVLLRTRGSVALADPGCRRADARVSEAWLAHRAHFRHALLESVVLAVVTRLDRQPLHAAAVADGATAGHAAAVAYDATAGHAAAVGPDRAALLLCARGGTGKSTLAWAAGRAGLRVLSEDTVYLQSRPGLRAWGMPGPLHLPPEQAGRFAGLEGIEPVRLPTGKTKLRVAHGVAGGDGWPWAERIGVCLLRRGVAPAGVDPVSADELASALTGALEPGFDLFRETLAEPVRVLAAGGGWRLHLPPDPRDAVPWLTRLLDVVRAREG